MLDNYFKDNDFYNKEMISTSTGIPSEEVNETLEWYARLELGEKIKKCVEKKGSCEFEAEL